MHLRTAQHGRDGRGLGRRPGRTSGLQDRLPLREPLAAGRLTVETMFHPTVRASVATLHLAIAIVAAAAIGVAIGTLVAGQPAIVQAEVLR
jgi:hypothetical protein